MWPLNLHYFVIFSSFSSSTRCFDVTTFFVINVGALLLKHVLKCAKEDGNIDIIYL